MLVPVRVEFNDKTGVRIRKKHSRRVWHLSLEQAVGAIARAAQMGEIRRRQGR